MSAIAMSVIAFAIIFGSTLLGMFVRTILNEEHLSADSRDVMKLGTSMIATMAALVLSLLIASAKGPFDTVKSGLDQVGSKIVLLDRTMARYAPETKEARHILRRIVITTIKRIWPIEKTSIVLEEVGQAQSGIDNCDEKIRQLSARDDDQRRLQSQALQITGEITQARLLLIQRVTQRSFPMPLIVLLISWLTLSFSTLACSPLGNTTVIAVMSACALSAASALFVVLELDQPFGGVIINSSVSLFKVLE
jgi:hypothetical protein